MEARVGRSPELGLSFTVIVPSMLHTRAEEWTQNKNTQILFSKKGGLVEMGWGDKAPKQHRSSAICNFLGQPFWHDRQKSTSRVLRLSVSILVSHGLDQFSPKVVKHINKNKDTKTASCGSKISVITLWRFLSPNVWKTSRKANKPLRFKALQFWVCLPKQLVNL